MTAQNEFDFFSNVMDLDKSVLQNLDMYSGSVNVPIGTMTFQQFYTTRDLLRRTAAQHSWTRASVITVARAAIGGGFSFVRHPVYGRTMTPEEIKKSDDTLMPLYDFFYSIKPITNIQDLNTVSYKIFYTVVSFVLYGQVAWEILRDKQGNAIGFDVLPGVVFPNIDEFGNFSSPAYYYRAWNSQQLISYNDPQDLMFATWPGVDGFTAGSSEFDALASTTIPSDLYAAIAYKSQFENINAPHNGVWVIDQTTSDDDYKKFLTLLAHRYTGVQNYGRNPLVIRGRVEFKETKIRHDDAPYLEGRQYNQDEISAVTGVSGAKMGISSNTTRSNYREVRRDFHENTLRPIFAMLEDAIYSQIIVREFKLKQFKMIFNRPDLSTALEDATINARYIQNGVLNPNEVRQSLGKADRQDELGNTFFHPNNSIQANEDGINSENMPERMTEPSGGSNRQFNVQRPADTPRLEHEVKVDNELMRTLWMKELGTWRDFAVRVISGKRNRRNFEPRFIGSDVASSIQECINLSANKEEIREVFDILIDSINGENKNV